MIKSNSISMKLFLLIMTALLGVVLLFFSGANTLFLLALILWLFLMVYSVQDFVNKTSFVCFLVAFFVFLLGRELVFCFFDVSRYYIYLEEYNNITFLLLSVSLVFVSIGYSNILFSKFRMHRVSCALMRFKTKNPDKQRIVYRKTCAWVLMICYVSATIYTIIRVAFVRDSGYLASYLDGGISNKLGFLSYFSSFLIVAISLYLTTKPDKKKTICILILYELYGILTLFTGHRYIFSGISMYCCIYLCIRQKSDGNWIKRKYLVVLIVLVPVLVLLMTAMDSLRLGNRFEFTSLYNSFISFMDQQGGSVNVIKRIFYYEDRINDMHFTSFSNVRNILFENLIVRKLFHVQTYIGNSLAHALNGNSLAHRLSYYEYGDLYLAGHGVGSCYIAELFHDFGWLGVVLGSWLYGIILRRIDDISFGKPFRDGIFLAAVYYIILAPRGEFDAAIGTIFSLYSLLAMAFIIIVSNLLFFRE